MKSNLAVPTILYHDAWLLAVDKPAGIIVHSDGTNATTLTDRVHQELLAQGIEHNICELQAINRLDRDTTGIVLFSLNKETQPAFDALVSAHETHKNYLAIACGIPSWKTKLINAPLARDRHDARRMRIDQSGKPAQTRVTVLATRPRTSTAPDLSLLSIELLSGRKHQIRVHLASLGFPLLGDTLYGRPVRAGLNGRPYPLMLHAQRMELVHPITHETVVIETPVPKRFGKLFKF